MPKKRPDAASTSFWFLVPGRPRGKGRPRFGRAFPRSSPGGRRRAVVYTPPRTTAYESAIRVAMQAAVVALAHPPALPFEGPCRLHVEAFFGGPCPRRRVGWRIARPDIDNVLKVVMDALNGRAWNDDAQVACAKVDKYSGGSWLGLRVEVSRL